MKNFRFKSGIGLVFALLFILNIYVIITGLINRSDLLIVCGILLSCFQFYLHEQFRQKSDMLKNQPYQPMVNDFLAFIPLRFRHHLFVKDASRLLLNKKQCEVLVKRSKNFSTEIIQDNLLNPNDPGFEYIHINDAFINLQSISFRVEVGGRQCRQPYSLSILNFGTLNQKKLSKKCIHAISQGANIGNCAVNTGEDGLSAHLIRGGGDLIWHINYDDCSLRNDDRSWNETVIKTIAMKPYIKMIEVKFQLQDIPAAKKGLTAFAIFSFVKVLRILSEGKPVGINLSNPAKETLSFLGNAMTNSGVYFDFMTIESTSTREPGYKNTALFQQKFFEAIVTARRIINQFNLSTKIIAAGVIVTEYDILRAVALGADACFNASDTLLATHSVTDHLNINQYSHSIRIANFHRNTIAATQGLMELCWYEKLSEVNPADFFRKINSLEIKTLEEIVYQADVITQHPIHVNLN